MLKRHGTGWLWLVIGTFALRAFVPAGYMPAPLAGGLPFVPCPAAAPGLPSLVKGSGHHAGADHDGNSNHKGDHHHGGDESAAWEFCPFGAISGGTGPAASCDSPLPPPWREAPPLAPAAAPFQRLLASTACQPRAPPLEPSLHV